MIADSEDVTLFAVHININKELEYLEAGEISRDVVKKRGDRWVYEDKTHRLRAGDKLYFWLYVIVDGLGYRLDNQEYTVKSNFYIFLFYIHFIQIRLDFFFLINHFCFVH